MTVTDHGLDGPSGQAGHEKRNRPTARRPSRSTEPFVFVSESIVKARRDRRTQRPARHAQPRGRRHPRGAVHRGRHAGARAHAGGSGHLAAAHPGRHADGRRAPRPIHLAETLPSFTLAIDRVAKVFTYAGCKVNRAVLSGTQGGLLRLALDIVAQSGIRGRGRHVSRRSRPASRSRTSSPTWRSRWPPRPAKCKQF